MEKSGIVVKVPLFEYSRKSLMSYPNSQIMELCCFGKKELHTKFDFVSYIYIGIVKINIISKFVLATNNIMYVHQSEPKKEIKQR